MKKLKPEEMSEGYFRVNVINPWLDKHARYWFATTGVLSPNGIPDYCVQIGNITAYIEAKQVDFRMRKYPYEINQIRKIHRSGVPVFVVHPLNWVRISLRILALAFPGEPDTDMSRLDKMSVYTIFKRAGEC